MKLLSLTVMIAGLSAASTALAQQRVPVKEPIKTEVPKADVKNLKERASEADKNLSALSELGKGKKLTAQDTNNSCNGNSLVQSTAALLTGFDKTAFMQAVTAVNSGSTGTILQPCQAGEPITEESSLKNLAKMTTYVGQKVMTNQGMANSPDIWAEGLMQAIPGLSKDDALARIKGLAGSKCQILKLSI
jgi:hypothetical protein